MNGTRDTLISSLENRRMFDRIARRYDLMNSIMSLGLHHAWRRAAIRFLFSGSGSDFLDIGCGTGDVAIALAKANGSCRVTGVDPSPDMLAILRRKLSGQGVSSRITAREGDACRLDFAHHSFDGVVCAFCLRNIENRAQALAEMRRVLRPAGTLAVLELTVPCHQPARLVHTLYTRHVIPLLGSLLSQGDAYRYLARSIDHFPPPDAVVGEFRKAGFHDASARALTGGFVTLFTARAPEGSGTP